MGDVIAIISADKPDAPVQRSIAGTAAQGRRPAAARRPQETRRPNPPRSAAAPAPAPAPTAPMAASSPRPRRGGLALEQGLDLNRLVEAGHPQPYHAADIEVLKALPARRPPAAAPAGCRRAPPDGRVARRWLRRLRRMGRGGTPG